MLLNILENWRNMLWPFQNHNRNYFELENWRIYYTETRAIIFLDLRMDLDSIRILTSTLCVYANRVHLQCWPMIKKKKKNILTRKSLFTENPWISNLKIQDSLGIQLGWSNCSQIPVSGNTYLTGWSFLWKWFFPGSHVSDKDNLKVAFHTEPQGSLIF